MRQLKPSCICVQKMVVSPQRSLHIFNLGYHLFLLLFENLLNCQFKCNVTILPVYKYELYKNDIDMICNNELVMIFVEALSCGSHDLTTSKHSLSYYNFSIVAPYYFISVAPVQTIVVYEVAFLVLGTYTSIHSMLTLAEVKWRCIFRKQSYSSANHFSVEAAELHAITSLTV